MAKFKKIPYTQAQLSELLNYEPQTGRLTWRQDRGKKVKAGDKAGWRAYTQDNVPMALLLRIDGIAYGANRIIWKLAYGKDPTGEVTYRNGNPWDLRLTNLWDVPGKAHSRNRRRFKDSKSGFVGVRPSGDYGKWQAYRSIDGKLQHLGVYADKREAAATAAWKRLSAGCSLRHATGNKKSVLELLPEWLL